jgi:hypothetical protein
MRLGREVEFRGRTPAPRLDVVIITFAYSDGFVRQVSLERMALNLSST